MGKERKKEEGRENKGCQGKGRSGEERGGGKKREQRRGKRASREEEESWLKQKKKGENMRIIKSSHKSKRSTFLKREILVVSETGGWKSPLNMHDVMYCTFTTHTRPHSIC